jgi:hypothetical protein
MTPKHQNFKLFFNFLADKHNAKNDPKSMNVKSMRRILLYVPCLAHQKITILRYIFFQFSVKNLIQSESNFQTNKRSVSNLKNESLKGVLVAF